MLVMRTWGHQPYPYAHVGILLSKWVWGVVIKVGLGGLVGDIYEDETNSIDDLGDDVSSLKRCIDASEARLR